MSDNDSRSVGDAMEGSETKLRGCCGGGSGGDCHGRGIGPLGFAVYDSRDEVAEDADVTGRIVHGQKR